MLPNRADEAVTLARDEQGRELKAWCMRVFELPTVPLPQMPMPMPPGFPPVGETLFPMGMDIVMLEVHRDGVRSKGPVPWAPQSWLTETWLKMNAPIFLHFM